MGGCVHSWAVVFVHGQSCSFVGGCVRLQAVVFICWRSCPFAGVRVIVFVCRCSCLFMGVHVLVVVGRWVLAAVCAPVLVWKMWQMCHVVWLLASLLGRWQWSPVEVGVEGVQEREGRDLHGWWWSLATVVVRWHCVGVVVGGGVG